MFPSKDMVDRIREQFPVGTRVELVQMDDIQAPPPGTKGTVLGVDDIGSLLMKWDNGSSLNVVYGEDIVQKLDSETRVCPLCGKEYHEPPALSRADNRTMICPDCGMREALETIGIEPDEILRSIHEKSVKKP